MKETDWFPLTVCPVREGVYRTLHLNTARTYIEGYSMWIPGIGWGFTENTPERAATYRYPSSQQSKQWKGVLK